MVWNSTGTVNNEKVIFKSFTFSFCLQGIPLEGRSDSEATKIKNQVTQERSGHDILSKRLPGKYSAAGSILGKAGQRN
jgi:hypothetical protein